MSADMSFFHLITGASLVVQLVMLLLLVVSMVSWTMIFRRRSALREAQDAADDFEDRFWSGGDLATLYREVSSDPGHAIGMAGIFKAGFKEFARLRGQCYDRRLHLTGLYGHPRIGHLCQEDQRQ